MSEQIILKSHAENGEPLEVIFEPQRGMNFVSYKKGSCEIIDQSTRSLFEERFAGLGAMIGPHFHHRQLQKIPPLNNPSLFPHVQAVFAKGVKEPFSHGIGRYAPWSAIHTQNTISATLIGEDKWKGVSLQELEGQSFTMTYDAELSSKGLKIKIAVASDLGSVVGLHTYYALVDGKGSVKARIGDLYNDHGEIKKIPSEWSVKNGLLNYTFEREMDYGFYPKEGLWGEITLTTGNYTVNIEYTTQNQENSWQLWHPVGKSFVCLEPLSAKIPSNPQLATSQLEVIIKII